MINLLNLSLQAWFLAKIRKNKEIAKSSIEDLVSKIDEKNFTTAIEFLNLTQKSTDNDASNGRETVKKFPSTVSFVKKYNYIFVVKIYYLVFYGFFLPTTISE